MKLEKFIPRTKENKKGRWFNTPAAVLIALGSTVLGSIATETMFNDDSARTVIVHDHPAGCPCNRCSAHKPTPHVTPTTIHEVVTTTTEPHVTTTTEPHVTTTTKPSAPFKPPVTTTTLTNLGSGYGYGK